MRESVATPSPSPEDARLITEDIERFWQAFDQARPEFDAQVFDELYLQKATPGLEDWTKLRIRSAENLARAVRKHPRFYAAIRDTTRRVPEMEPRIRTAFRELKALYPEALFPDVYFVIGRLNSGGTRTRRGLILGVEMESRTPDLPTEELNDWLRQVLLPVEAIPTVVAHELIHFQQKDPESKPDLLFSTLREGVADFLGEKICGEHMNGHIHDWADPRAEELWREFYPRRHGLDRTGWLYGGGTDEGRPADLSYWLGYKITEAFWQRRQDKKQAVREILDIDEDNAEAFLEASGYGRSQTPAGDM